MNINLFATKSKCINQILRLYCFNNACKCPHIASTNLTSNYSTITTQHKRRLQFDANNRFYCDDTENKPSPYKLPPLMSGPKLTWPSMIKSFRNFILANFIIRPYFDHDFNISEFVQGAKHALQVISNSLANGDYNALDGFVSDDVMPLLQRSIGLMSLAQRECLAIDKEDIYFSFPYQVGVIFDEGEEGEEQKRYVEITMVFHTLKGLNAMKERGDELPLNIGMLPEYQKKISIANYRFIREYTKGIEGNWTVNLVNHFKPADDFPEDM